MCLTQLKSDRRDALLLFKIWLGFSTAKPSKSEGAYDFVLQKNHCRIIGYKNWP
jgi:hypothetical protein